MMVEFLIGVAIWYVIGILAAIHATKRDLDKGEDFKADDLLVAVPLCLLGPILWWIVIHYHWKEDGAPILIKGRNKNERGLID